MLYEQLNAPHGAPLSNVVWLDDSGHFVHERDGTSYVKEHTHKPHLLPWHRHILEELIDSMRRKFEGTKVDTLVMPEFSAGHVTMVLDNFADNLWGKLFFLYVTVSMLLLCCPLLLAQLSPFLCLYCLERVEPDTIHNQLGFSSAQLFPAQIR
jgi:hypothetical protein